ncbi:hypothetical protein ACU8DI_10025 [Psychroserpens sp. BH13MA-6]
MSDEITSSKKKRWKINWTSDKIMSTSALFISVISLIALLYQSYLAREDNKLTQMQQSASVLPYLNQWLSDYNDTFKLVIGNKGVGPAFITNVDITVDNSKNFQSSNAFFQDMLKTYQPLDTISYLQSDLVKGFVLPANDAISVIEVYGSDNITAFKKAFNAMNIVFKITYEDVYGTQWLLTNVESKDNSANIPILISKD